jgi:hypothetical protein
MATNQNALGLTNGRLTKLPIRPRAESTVEIQNTNFVGGVNFIISPFLYYLYYSINKENKLLDVY